MGAPAGVRPHPGGAREGARPHPAARGTGSVVWARSAAAAILAIADAIPAVADAIPAAAALHPCCGSRSRSVLSPSLPVAPKSVRLGVVDFSMDENLIQSVGFLFIHFATDLLPWWLIVN